MISNWQRSISVSCGAQDLLEYLVGGKDSDPAGVLSMEFSVQLCQKEIGQNEQNICIPVKFEWSLHPLDMNLPSQSHMLTPACTQNELPGHLTV